MELTITRGDFLQGLSRAQGVADRRSSMPVLANVLLESEGPGGLRVSATDLHLGVTGVVPARIEKGGSTTAAARTLFDIVRNLPDGEVHISVDENQWLEVRSGRVQYRIAGIPSEDFPDLPSPEDVDFFSLERAVLSKLIEQTMFAVSPDEGRPHLNGALFEGEGKVLRMVGTDGHRLSMSEHTVEQGAGLYSFNMLVPLKAIQELRKLLDEGEGPVEVGASGPNAFFRRHLPGEEEGVETEMTMSVKLVEARFPPYEKVIPASSKRQVNIERLAFLEALRRASLISRDKTVAIKMTFNEGKMVITSDNPDVGEAREEIDAEYEGEELTVGFNGRYIMDVLGSLGTPKIELSLSGTSDACVIKPFEEGGYLGVVMPMRL